MTNCFRLTSLCVHIGDLSAKLEADSLLQPAKHQPRVSRAVFHETVHYWQYLAFGFIANLADEELCRLRAFEAGDVPAPGRINHEYRRIYDCVGFSAIDLQEALARYWDVHVLGPKLLLELDLNDPARRIPLAIRSRYEELEAQGLLMHGTDYTDLAFDLAMEAAAGNYARPYLMLREQYPPKLAAGLFPIIGGIALMAERPAPFFARLTRMAESRIGELATGNIHNIWQAWYQPVRRLGIQLAEELGENLSSAILVYQERDLAKYIPHDFAAFERQNAINALADSEQVKVMAAEQGVEPMYIALFELERRLLLPGDPDHRAFLSYWISPLCVKLTNGERWLPGDSIRRKHFPNIDESERKLRESREMVADAVQDLDNRWLYFLRASIKTHHKPMAESNLGQPEDHAYLSAIQALIRSSESNHTDYSQLFFSLINEYPVPSRALISFFARHMLLGTLCTEDIRHVNEMVCIQLASNSGLNEYDSATGYMWNWNGQPALMMLASELGRYAARHINADDLANECAALLLRSLDAFMTVAAARMSDKQVEKTNSMREMLQAELAQKTALTQVNEMIENLRKVKE